MKVLIDTSVWSLALRRRSQAQPAANELASLIRDGRATIIGPIRQEILSGIRESVAFEKLRAHLRAFPDVPLTSADYEEATSFFSRCRARGIQGSNTDFLICAAAVRNELGIFTTDGDFSRFARVLPIALHQP